MTKTPLKPLLYFFTGLLLISCQEDIDTKMVLNGNEFLSSASQPTLTQKDAYYEVLVTGAAKIIAADKSEPKSAVNERKWIVKGPGGNTLHDINDKAGFEFECKESGWYSVYLEVNEQVENAQTCWVYAKGETKIAEPAPVLFELLSPKDSEVETEESTMELQLHTELFDESELDGIVVNLNGKRVKDLALDLNEALTTAQLNLKKGENTVLIDANIGGERFKQELTINRKSESVSPPPRKPIPGCTDPKAINYNPKATVDDGTCKTKPIRGCTDPTASNYNPLATVDDGSCKPKEDPNAPLLAEGKLKYADLSAESMNACESSGLSSASVKVKAKKRISMESVLIYTKNCGRANIKIESKEGVIGSKSGLTINKGKNELDLLAVHKFQEINKDQDWTITIDIIPDPDNNCPDTPEFSNLGQCNPKNPTTKHLELSGSQKDLIGQIKYRY